MERRIPVTLALGALSVTVALAFGRVFDSDRYLAPLIVAALLPHAIGALGRWRALRAALVWAASGAALAIYAVFLTPGAGSPSALTDRITEGWHVIEHDAVPIRTTDGAVLLAVLVVWLVAAVADHLAFRRSASLGALGPGVIVLIWIGALGTHHGQGLTVGVFGAAAVLFLALQHQALLGQHRTRLGGGRIIDAPGLIVVGVVTGIVALGLGVAAAAALPGGEKPLFQGGGLGPGEGQSYRTTVPPLLDVGEKLHQGTRRELFTVDAAAPDYWRIAALDEYRSVSRGQWTLTAEGADAVGVGLDEQVPKGALVQHYAIGPLDERWMPAAYRPVRVSRADSLVVRASSTLVTSASRVSGLRYTVVSATPAQRVTPEQQARAADPAPASLASYTRLPRDFPDPIRATAARATAGLTSPFEKARALRDFFRNGNFVYDPSVSLGDDENAIESFLFIRHGFCVQFASAYATMARAVGIPARVAVGFTPGTRTGNGPYRVTNFDAHAWPEIWLSGLGWTHLFDPTPPSPLPGGSDLPGDTAPAPRSTTSPPPTTPGIGQTTTPTTPPATTPPTGPGAGTPAPRRSGGVTVARGAARGGGSSLPWLLVLALVVAALGIAPAALVLGLKARRRARRRARSEPAEAIAGAWAEAVDDLTDHRVSWPSSTTPRTLARRVPPLTDAATEAPLRALADSYGAVRYGDGTPAPEEARLAWQHADALRRALDASAGVVGRIRARIDPATLRRQPEPAGWSRVRRSPSTKD